MVELAFVPTSALVLMDFMDSIAEDVVRNKFCIYLYPFPFIVILYNMFQYGLNL